MKPTFRLHPVFAGFAIFAGLVGLATSGSFGCFSLKEPPCAFSCVQPPHRCPEQYSCGADGLCHRQGATGVCALKRPEGGVPASDGGDGGDARGDAAADSRDGGDAAAAGDGTPPGS